jgi:ribbon-helix-helix CopG family protein
MKSISATLPNELDAKLTSTARQRRSTKSAIVRAALEQYLARDTEPPPESVAALAKDLIGCVSGGPPDLSYNKKYLEGLGQDSKA